MLSAAKAAGWREEIKNVVQEDGTLLDPESEKGAMIANPKTPEQALGEFFSRTLINLAKSHDPVVEADEVRKAKQQEIDEIADKMTSWVSKS